MSDDNEKDDDPQILSETDLSGVQGGRRLSPTTVTGKMLETDLIDGVNNDTLFAGSGDDKSFNLGMPGKK